MINQNSKRFPAFSKINKIFILVFLFGCLVSIIVAFLSGMPLSPDGVSRYTGVFLGAIFSSTIIAYLVGLIAKRSNRVFSVVFNLFLGLTILTGMIAFTQERQSIEALDELARVNMEHQTQPMSADHSQDGEPAAPSSAEGMSAPIQTLQRVADLSDGTERDFMQSVAAFFRGEQLLEAQVEKITKQVFSDTAMSISQMKSQEILTDRINLCKKYLYILAQYEQEKNTLVKRMALHLGDNLHTQQFLNEIEKQYKNRLPAIKASIESSRSVAETYSEWYEFLTSHWGKWNYDPEKNLIVLANQELIEQYKALVAQAAQAEAVQAEKITELIALNQQAAK